MPWHRRILVALCVLLGPGSLALTTGYAFYIRSDAYRASVAKSVGDFLNLTAELASVIPRSRASRGFGGIKLFLPGGDTQIFSSDRAVWQEVRRDNRVVNELDVYDGWLQLGSRRMGEADYHDVLRGSLAHDFVALNLAAVRFHQIDLRWHQPGLRLDARAASGVVNFEPDGSGRAQLEARTLNGTTVDEPILIRAAFITGAELAFRNILLTVPRMPLAALALDDMTGAPVTQGWFDGTVSFQPAEDVQVYTLRGSVGEARLEELTRRLPGGQVRGRVDVELTEAQVAPGQVLALAFNGKLGQIQIADIARRFGAADLTGRVDLNVGRCRYAAGLLEHLSAKADVVDVPADVATRLIGKGSITGTLRVRVNSLLIEEQTLRHADIDIEVTPPAGEPGIIERAVVLAIAKEALGVDLGRVGEYLPESVEYARMGCKLIASGNELRIKGTHGDNNETVLTLRILGREVGVLDAPDRTYSLAGLLETIRSRIEDYDLRALLDRLQ